MSKLKDILYSYIYNPSVENIFELAEVYFDKKQYAAALSYYLKTAETTADKDLQYYCLLQCAKCFEIPGNRKHSVYTLYKHAVHLLPERPEAYYFLSKSCDDYKDWFDCYTYAHLGLQKPNINDKYTKKLQYYSEYLLLFQKAVSAWHIGKGQESRNIFQILINKYYNQLDPLHKVAVFNNATVLGCGPAEIAYVPYNNQQKLRYSFNNLNRINQNYSQILQDIFVLSVLDGKESGTYLEIGSGDPYYGNNTYLLENNFGWAGISIEIDQNLCNKYTDRKNTVLCKNALEVDYNEILSNLTTSTSIDYLQLDCDPPEVTYNILQKIPFDKYKFAVITYEHDYFIDITRSYRDRSREYLKSNGYMLLVNDLSPEGMCNFEDWWVHPDLIRHDIIEKMVDNNLSSIKDVRKYMYGQ